MKSPLIDKIGKVKIKDLPEDSLLRLRPVRHALLDPYFDLACRPIDCNWNYAGITLVMVGYNPVYNNHFYSATSAFNDWLKDPINLGRALNHEDRLVKEVLLMAHDYLHSWAYRAIENLDPNVNVNQVPITRENIDDFVYIHLITEAAAVIGLDYWYLCVKNVNQRCSLGSLAGAQTVEYQEDYISEYRRFNPSLVVQHPDFFFRIVNLFCTSEFDGFSFDDLRKSPALFRWLVREMKATPCQLFNTRLWLSHVGGFRLSDEELSQPLSAPTDKQRQLAEELGRLLWKKIKLGSHLFFAPKSTQQVWTYKSSDDVDFRVVNLRRIPTKVYDWNSLRHPKENFRFYLQQYLSQFWCPVNQPFQAQEELKSELETIKQTFDQARLLKLGDKLEKVYPSQPDPAPLEMIFLN